MGIKLARERPLLVFIHASNNCGTDFIRERSRACDARWGGAVKNVCAAVTEGKDGPSRCRLRLCYRRAVVQARAAFLVQSFSPYAAASFSDSGAAAPAVLKVLAHRA